uniref:CUB domain-containing protein n=1 Tax=Neolamprologus brichardi TaxID=32507 RepID=A0A3Q4GTZ6_NEOBR
AEYLIFFLLALFPLCRIRFSAKPPPFSTIKAIVQAGTYLLHVIFDFRKFFNIHVRNRGIVHSPGFPDYPYPPNANLQWRLRAEPSHRVRLDFHTLILEDDCQRDFIKAYDSLAPIEKRALTE